MSGRRTWLAHRRAALLTLAWLLLLAGQQIALQHPLGHLGHPGQVAHAQADGHEHVHPTDDAAPACDLCLSCAAAGHLAAAAPIAAHLLGGLGIVESHHAGVSDGPRRAAGSRHNRGPPARA